MQDKDINTIHNHNFIIMAILIPTDFSNTAFNAYRYGMHLAERLGEEVVLMHVLQGSFTTIDGVYLSPLKEMADAARERMVYFAGPYAEEKGIFIPKVKVVMEVRYGMPGFSLADYANDHKMRMIIMGTRGEHSVLERVIGSTSIIVSKQAKCPIILVRKNSPIAVPTKTVFAIDSAGGILSALGQFATWNKTVKSSVKFVHVQSEQSDVAKASVSEVVKEFYERENVNFTYEVAQIVGENVKESILDFCKYNEVDLLTVVHRKDTILEALFGRSMSRDLAEEVQTPIMILKT